LKHFPKTLFYFKNLKIKNLFAKLVLKLQGFETDLNFLVLGTKKLKHVKE